ncbi:septum site-determining protein MinC [Chitinimonas sp. BJYL2]|uniref:septum site-determining protein MinC n=1 Tax=Chitinimonas sp. BJYL2 TaxID=2976696 RepID=UPI0022B30291|nr:septum site-determining protein MinC [Chitinimonas sp. BJYL2]
MTATVKPAPTRQSAPFELKSAALNLIAFTPKTASLDELGEALALKLAVQPGFFSGEAAVIDLSDWPGEATSLELSGLVTLLRKSGLHALAARGGAEASRRAADAAGLLVLPELPAQDSQVATGKVEAKSAAPGNPPALVIDKPVRSGQQVYARGGDLIVLALVSHGAELIADGNIHVYAPLRGRALAGARGDTQARVFTYCMEAELLSVAGVYRAIDEQLPSSIKGKAAQVRLDGNKLVIEALSLG